MAKLTKWKQVQKLKKGTKVLVVRPPVEVEVKATWWDEGNNFLEGEHGVDDEREFKSDLEEGYVFYVIN